MRYATQEDVNNFYNAAMQDPAIFPYLQTGKYTNIPVVPPDRWHDLYLISDTGNCYLHIWIDRTKDNEFIISLYAKNTFAAGRGIQTINELIRRYKPRAINANVHASNKKSLALNARLFQHPGVPEELAAWNMLTGAYENLIQFRKIL